VELATSGTDLATARVVAARVALFDGDGSEVARWDWGSERADGLVGEVAQTLRTLSALDVPLATFDAMSGLTLLDRECRRRHLETLEGIGPVLDVLVLDRLLDPADAGARSLDSIAERYGVEPGSLAAGRLVRAMLERPGLEGPPAELHERQVALDGSWPVVPLDDIRLIEDTQPIPVPPPRPSGTVPVLDFTTSIALPRALEAAPAWFDMPPPAAPPGPVPSQPVAPAPEADAPDAPEYPDETRAPVEQQAAAKPRRIHVAAAIVTDSAGRAVVVRKRGTTGFMQPGGKIEPGESALTTLVRELREELGLEVDVDATEFLGSYEAAALNEPGQIVRAEVFALATDTELHAGGEIEEIVWLTSPHDTESVELAPLTLEVLLPLWASRRPALF